MDPLTLFGAPTVKMEANPKLRTGLHLVQQKQWQRESLLFNLLQDAEALPDGGLVRSCKKTESKSLETQVSKVKATSP